VALCLFGIEVAVLESLQEHPFFTLSMQRCPDAELSYRNNFFHRIIFFKNSMPKGDAVVTDLPQTVRPPESGPAESEPRPYRRNGGISLLLLIFVLIIPFAILFGELGDRPGGFQIAALVMYTISIPFVASEFFVKLIPWKALTRRKFLLRHCRALAIVYVITTGALAAKPHLPDWFTEEVRKGSFFDWFLIVTFYLLACNECNWGEGLEDKDSSVAQ